MKVGKNLLDCGERCEFFGLFKSARKIDTRRLIPIYDEHIHHLFKMSADYINHFFVQRISHAVLEAKEENGERTGEWRRQEFQCSSREDGEKELLFRKSNLAPFVRQFFL